MSDQYHPNAVICHECGQGFINHHLLHKHKQKEHVPNFKCPICPYICGHTSKLMDNLTDRHNLDAARTEQPSSCKRKAPQGPVDAPKRRATQINTPWSNIPIQRKHSTPANPGFPQCTNFCCSASIWSAYTLTVKFKRTPNQHSCYHQDSCPCCQFR